MRRLAVGAVYGAGFTIGVVVVVAAATGGLSMFFPSEGVKPSVAKSEAKALPDLDKQLVLSTRRTDVNEFGRLVIVGNVRNTGPNVAGTIVVFADLFEADGSILYQCSHQIAEGLAAEQVEYFVVDCFGMSKALVPKYASHKLHVRRLR